MEPSSPFVQNHEFSHAFLLPFSFNHNSRTPCRRELRKGGQDESFWSAKQSSSLDSGASHSPGNQELGRNSVFASVGKPVRDRVQNPALILKRQRDDNPFSSTGKPVRGIENQFARKWWDYHSMQISDNQYFEKVFKNLRHKLNRSNWHLIKRPMYWSGFFLSTTLNASVHLGPNYNENLVTYRNVVRQRAEVFLEHVFVILNVSRIEWTFFSWMRSTLHHDKVMKWAKAKVHVKWDSVLFLGKIQEHSEANAKCKDQLQRLPTVQRMRRIRVTFSRDTRDRNLSESWTGFTQFALLNEKTSWKEHVLWGAAHDNSSNCQTWSVVARKLAQYVESSSTKGKASMSYRESEARPCWKVERHLFICPDDKNKVEKPLKTQGKSWNFQQKLPCLVSWRPRRVRTSIEKSKADPHKILTPKHACIVEAHESARKRLEGTLSKDHRDHIAEKVVPLVESVQSCVQVRSHAPSGENSGCENRSGQRMGEARKDASMANDQSK